MSRHSRFAEIQRRERQQERTARLEQKRLLKRALREAKREARRASHVGHVSDTDPTQPPMLGAVARIVGEIS